MNSVRRKNMFFVVVAVQRQRYITPAHQTASVCVQISQSQHFTLHRVCQHLYCCAYSVHLAPVRVYNGADLLLIFHIPLNGSCHPVSRASSVSTSVGFSLRGQFSVCLQSRQTVQPILVFHTQCGVPLQALFW